MIQSLIDRYYTPGHDKIWADGRLTVDEKIDRAHSLWVKVCARIKRETGYTIGS